MRSNSFSYLYLLVYLLPFMQFYINNNGLGLNEIHSKFKLLFASVTIAIIFNLLLVMKEFESS